MASVQAKVDEGCTSSTDEAVRWEDLPGELLSKIASGRNALKAMRLVCSTWQAGYDNSVTGLRHSVAMTVEETCIYAFDGTRPRDKDCFIPHIANRFPRAIRVQLGNRQISNADLRLLRGSNIQVLDFNASDFVSSKALRVFSGLSLTDLNLQYTNVKDIGLATLKGLPLTRLSLKGCQKITGGGFVGLLGMPLNWLDLGSCPKVTSAGIVALRGFPLKWLSLDGCSKVTTTGVVVLRALPLTSLNLGGCSKITSVGFALLQGLLLTHLNVACCSEITVEGLIALRGLPLTALNLGYCGLNERCIEALGGWPLRRLNLYHMKVTTFGLVSLRGLPTLTDLGLRWSCRSFTPEGLEALSELPLTRLNLDLRPYNLGGALYLMASPSFYEGGFYELQGLKLQDLSLVDHQGVRDEGFRTFWDMPLTKLNLSDCTSMTGESLEAMQNLPLTVLKLDNCVRLGDDSLHHIRNLPLTNLSVFGIEGITDLSVPMLRGMSSLKNLDISGTSITVKEADILTSN